MAEQANEMADWPKPSEGDFVWTEIASTDTKACEDFYTKVFGWTFKHSTPSADPGMDYIEFSTTAGGNPSGGMYQIDPAWFGGTPPPPHFMTYVAVDDVDANAKKAVELGGTVLRGPMDIPNVGRMCVIRDPTGAVFSTFIMKQ